MTLKDSFTVDGNALFAHISPSARPLSTIQPTAVPAVVIVHGFPVMPEDRVNAVATLPALADYIAAETSFAAMSFASRGMHQSEGNFSLDGWCRDITGAIDLMVDVTKSEDVWLVGFGTGGALALMVGQSDSRVRGIASCAAPADFDDWARNPRKLMLWSREIGIIQDPSYPESFDQWAYHIRLFRAEDASKQLGDRSLIVIHGSEDKITPVDDAKAIAAAHPRALLRIIPGADHYLRHDPRAIALLLGWLERQLH